MEILTLEQKTRPIELCIDEWRDTKTGIRGFVSIFGSKTMPASGGGIRVSPNLGANDASIVAQRMRQKFNLTGPGDLTTGLPINGAGIVIQAKPEEVSPDVLIRFMRENSFVERGIGTAASTGIDTAGVCEAMGISHLQEPIVQTLGINLGSARFALAKTQDQLQNPISERHTMPMTAATGISAAEIFHNLFEPFDGKTVGVIGTGAVGGSFIHRAMELGANIEFIANSQGIILLPGTNKTDFRMLLPFIKKLGNDAVPRLHLELLRDLTKMSLVSLGAIISSERPDILVLAGPEGGIKQEIAASIPDETIIIPLANKPFSNDVDEQALSRRTKLIPPWLCNSGNAVLFSLADLGCRIENADELLQKAIASSVGIAEKAKFLGMGEPIWREIITNFI